MKSGILYGMCWEDPEIFTDLVDENHDVLTVCSAGDIALSVLTKKPTRVIAIDTNVDQIQLSRLKLWAFQNLNYQDCHRFIGTFGDIEGRAKWMEERTTDISPEVNQWIHSMGLDQKPLIQSGRFEKYLRFFARYLFPLAVSKAAIQAFLNCKTLAEQKQVYLKQIDNWKYRFLFRQFFGNRQRLGRHPDLLKHVKDDLAGVFYERMKHAWLEVPIQENYFFRFILTGQIREELRLPIWAQKDAFEIIRSMGSRLKFETGSIVDYLENTKDDFDAINLSNISEVMTKEEGEQLFDLCRAHVKPDGRLLLWNNMVERKPKAGWKLDEEKTTQYWHNRTGSLYGYLGVYKPI